MPISKENQARYPDNWASEIRPRILKRAGGCCEGSPEYPDCRAVNYAPHPVTRSIVVLTIAHLDHTPEHCGDDNLRAWCQRCHLFYDIPHHQETKRLAREAAGQQTLDFINPAWSGVLIHQGNIDLQYIPKRIQRERTKGWTMPPGAIYVGRARGVYGQYGNPHRIGDPVPTAPATILDAEAAVAWYRVYLKSKQLDLSPLRGKDLVCWCRLNQPCHADVLLELANKEWNK